MLHYQKNKSKNGALNNSVKAISDRPIRGEILSRDLLANLGLELAKNHSLTTKSISSLNLKVRFKDNWKVLNSAYFSLSEMSRQKGYMAAGAEWLLDNFHVIDEQVREIRRDLPSSYYNSLPRIKSEDWNGLPRVFWLACEYLEHADSIVQEDTLSEFISSFQENCNLELRELWAIPIMLRLSVVENLRRLSGSVIGLSSERQKADQIFSEMLGDTQPTSSDLLASTLEALKGLNKELPHIAPSLVRNLRTLGNSSSLAIQWIEEKLKDLGSDLQDLSKSEQQLQAADQISIGNCITSLKAIGRLNWRDWIENVSKVNSILLRDPSGVFLQSDFETRDFVRHRLEKLSARVRKTEIEVAEKALDLAAKAKQKNGSGADTLVGYYLVDEGLSELENLLDSTPPFYIRFSRHIKSHITAYYLSALSFLSLGISFVLYSIALSQGLSNLVSGFIFFLSLLPASQLATEIVQWLASKLITPRPISKLSYEKFIPEESRTLVTVQTIISSREHLLRTVNDLEIRAIGNQSDNIAFGILADLPDASSKVVPGDKGLISLGLESIQALNLRYKEEGLKFFILFRERVYNKADGVYIGWERKRGKLTEFNRFLRKVENTTFTAIEGDVPWLQSAKYIITLDNDTQLPPGSARKLIGAAAHPINTPVLTVDPQKGTIISRGYGIIQPRVGITLESASSSTFADWFSGQSGLDPYTKTVSDVYQDLFNEASYIGKGIFDIDVFEKALDGQIPENSVLSHDLLESGYTRCALASDIELFDDFPQRYHANSKRQHRWIRGDWQLLPWLGSMVPTVDGERLTPFTGLVRWKLIDNLRRSLVPVSSLLFLFVISAYSASPLFWLSVYFILTGFRAYSILYSLIFGIPIGYSLSTFFVGIFSDIRKSISTWFFDLSVLPHQALISVDATIRTIYRVYVSKVNLLEWETALATESKLKGSKASFWTAMLPAVALASVITLLSLFVGSNTLFTLSLGLFWFLSPVFAWQISQPLKKEDETISHKDEIYLESIAYDTWLYFRNNLKEEYNWLIPDNLQQVPQPVVAERTSPTNISLSMLAVISAYDLGFIPAPLIVDKLTKILGTVDKLEKYNGHLLNWYAIKDLRPLYPRYISSVDNGNYIGHLVSIKEALKAIPYSAIYSSKSKNFVLGQFPNLKLNSSFLSAQSQLVDGILPSLEFLSHDSPNEKNKDLISDLLTASSLVSWVPKLSILEQLGRNGLLPKKIEKIKSIIDNRSITPLLALRVIGRILSSKDRLLSLDIYQQDKEKLVDLIKSLEEASLSCQRLIKESESLLIRIEEIIKTTSFKFLFDEGKKLLSIGYNVETARLDTGSYDLLASEARLASFISIAKGDIPQSHWFFLGRTLTNTPGGKALISWSGTMFEYLMPVVVMKDFSTTLLGKTLRSIIEAQKSYALRRGVPWGISESAYGTVDYENTYQYRAFGVPGLGLKRGLVEDLVISPYSTLLALMIRPKESIINLKRLEKTGARGDYGFYEAIDYTKERLSEGESFHIVKSFFAHHQGMSLCSINNILNDGILQKRFHSDQRVKSCTLLLQERFPIRIPLILPHQAELLLMEAHSGEVRVDGREHFQTPHSEIPRTRIISNSEYSVFIDQSGSGFSSFKSDFSINRFRADNLRNNFGQYCYIRDEESKKFWSTTYQPTLVKPDKYEAIFSSDKAEFQRRNYDINSVMEVIVSPEDNVEIRKVSLTNHSKSTRKLSLTSFFEVSQASFGADLAHPAFSKLFIEADWLSEQEALTFKRRKRSANEQTPLVFHFLATDVVWAPTEFTANRAEFLGRGRDASRPDVIASGLKLSGEKGFVLDPAASIRHYVELDTNQSTAIYYITGVAENETELLYLISKYREFHTIKRAYELSWSTANVELKNQQFAKVNPLDFQHLANALVYNVKHLRYNDATQLNTLSQSALWRFGISGDEPIALLILDETDQVGLFQEMVLAHEYLRMRGIKFDLVVLNSKTEGYIQALNDELEASVRASLSASLLNQRAGIFIRSKNNISDQELILLKSSSRVVLYGAKGSLGKQLQFVPSEKVGKDTKDDFEDMNKGMFEHQVQISTGKFSDSGEFSMSVKSNSLPPAPWSNVISSEDLGFLVTDSGAGYTWYKNSREYRVSQWSNDPVSDQISEAIYIRDIDSSEYWCPTPLPKPSDSPVEVVHGFGYSSFSKTEREIKSNLKLFLDNDSPTKVYKLNLVNTGTKTRTLELIFYLEWVLGVYRTDAFRHISTQVDKKLGFIHARNTWGAEFANCIVSIGSSLDLQDFTTDRSDFLGENSTLADPKALLSAKINAAKNSKKSSSIPMGISLSRKLGLGFDSAGVLKYEVSLQPGEEKTIPFFVCVHDSIEEANSTLAKLSSDFNAKNSELNSQISWTSKVDSIRVTSPNKEFDTLVNGWLLYQTLSCRMNARTGFYQSSGAFGFRDQLQDSLAFLLSDPKITRNQILKHAARQFEEGDVQHWWHPPSGRGIRSRISDNYLWLPFAVYKYIQATGDFAILDEEVGFLKGPLLSPEQHDLYFTPEISELKSSLYDHCLKALNRAYSTGPHGLPLMGAGDWNDGMNLVGDKGTGESVWLAWFISLIMHDFSTIADRRGDSELANNYRNYSSELINSADQNAWDGEWYMRAYFDNGTPLGSKDRDECKIDSLAQSWSVINGRGNKERQSIALTSAVKKLVDDEHSLVRLLWPPFSKSDPSPGYIQSYPLGIRENGGQYTHGSSWLVQALSLAGLNDEAFRVFQTMNPVMSSKSFERTLRYKTEPYVTCGDVYSYGDHAGRGGWSWYTGSSGWFYQIAMGNILGIHRTAVGLKISPAVPSDWNQYQVAGTIDGIKFSLKMTRTGKSGIKASGKTVSGDVISWEVLRESADIEVTF